MNLLYILLLLVSQLTIYFQTQASTCYPVRAVRLAAVLRSRCGIMSSPRRISVTLNLVSYIDTASSFQPHSESCIEWRATLLHVLGLYESILILRNPYT